MHVRPLLYLALFSALSLVSACASAPAPARSAESYLKEGDAAYQSKKFDDAIAQWKKVKETFSSPELTTQAELKIADAHFENKAYIEAAAAYEDFRKLHPTHEKVSYALYRLALSHYHQIAGIDTDQTPVKNAVLTLETFLKQYPQSPYAAEVSEKLADCRVKQLAYENYVGAFYLKTGKYTAAIKRMNEALSRFPREPQLDLTLFCLGKAYIKAGNVEKGTEALQRLATQYPASPLNKEAAEFLRKQGAFAHYSSPAG